MIYYADEASLSITPSIVKTYALKGCRPTIKANTWINTRAYLMSAISEKGDMHYQIRTKPYDSQAVICFLKELLKKESYNIIIIWDNASIHKSTELKNFLSSYDDAKRLTLVNIPPYSPDLNPDEQVWGYLKRNKLRNQLFKDLKGLIEKATVALGEIASRKDLITNFFRHPNIHFVEKKATQNHISGG